MAGRPGSPAAGWLAATAFVCIAAVGAALVSQHVFGMEPCPWCVLQRVIFLAIAIACGIGLVGAAVSRRPAVPRIGAGLGFIGALCGIAAALWQHFQAAASASCKLTLADKIVSGWLGLDQLLPPVFEARANCSEAAVNLFGVPYDFWSLGLFVLIALVLWKVMRSQPVRRY